MTTPPPVDPKTAAQMLGVSVQYVRKQIKTNRLPAHRLGTAIRIEVADLLALREPVNGVRSTPGYDDYITKLADDAPALTSEQRDKLATLLKPARNARQKAVRNG